MTKLDGPQFGKERSTLIAFHQIKVALIKRNHLKSNEIIIALFLTRGYRKSEP